MSKPNSHRTFGGVYCHGNKIWPQKINTLEVFNFSGQISQEIGKTRILIMCITPKVAQEAL